MKLARTDRSAWTELMFTVDRWILVGIFFLMGAGLFIGYAASPAETMSPLRHFFPTKEKRR